MVCLPRMYRHRPPEIRGSRAIRKKLLLHRLAAAALRTANKKSHKKEYTRAKIQTSGTLGQPSITGWVNTE
eukprot:COSAG06_NODE_12714_length_1339_cov_6.137097_1_plen_70_part_10